MGESTIRVLAINHRRNEMVNIYSVKDFSFWREKLQKKQFFVTASSSINKIQIKVKVSSIQIVRLPILLKL